MNFEESNLPIYYNDAGNSRNILHCPNNSQLPHTTNQVVEHM